MKPEVPTADDLSDRVTEAELLAEMDKHCAEVEQEGWCPDPECFHNVEYVPDDIEF